MYGIIEIESKRIVSKKVFLVFLTVIILFSAYSTCSAIKCYNIPNQDGIAITWRQNLDHAKINLQGKTIDREYLSAMRRNEEDPAYLDNSNLDELVAMNYNGKSVRDLTDEDIGNFYLRRLSNIRTMLEESQISRYTQEEIEQFMQRAGQTCEIGFGYAEGWKVLNADMGIFVSLLLILISVLLLPLFGVDSKSNMQELYRSAKYGKKQLDHARLLTTFLLGGFLYLSGIVIFFVIKMLPFGLEGWNQCIQSNRDTFFSVYNITNVQQFFLNIIIGLIALLFVMSLSMLITIFTEKIMMSAAIFAFFWILLLLFDQMQLWQVNHYFANFMPLRMTSFSHYYVGNEIYRIFGVSLSCMAWSILLSAMLTLICLLAAAVAVNAKGGAKQNCICKSR